MKIALVHEHLVKRGGAEKVLKDFLKIWPKADVFTIVKDKKFVKEYFKTNPKIYNSYLQKLPFAKKKYNWYLPFEPRAIESFNFKNYDLIISNSHSFAKGVNFKGKTRHICYCHTPTRWIWLESESHVKRSNFPFFLKSVIPFLVEKLKTWDFQAAHKPNLIIANSHNVKKRIKKYYNRKSKVIWPAVDTKFFIPANKQRKDFFLYVSRLEPHKKPDLAIQAFSGTDYKLKVVGVGSMFEGLKKEAGKNIEFLGEVSNQELRELYQSTQALIFPQEEDFGLVPLEAQACGTPVIAYKKGGALETIKQGQTGIFFEKPTPESLLNAVENFVPQRFSKILIRKHAEKFSFENFQNSWQKIVKQVMSKRKKKW